MSSSVISISGEAAFLYAFFIEQPHNTGTIARTANNIFSYVSPLSISLCYLLLHILMRKQGRDSRGCLLEFSTQMAGNSERVEIPRPSLLRISTQTAQIGKIGRDSKFRRPLSCFHAPINRYPNYNMFLFPLLSSRIIYCYS